MANKKKEREYPEKVVQFSAVRGKEEFLKAIEFDEELYEIVKIREECYGSMDNPCYLCDVTYKPKAPELKDIYPEILETLRQEAMEISKDCRWNYPKSVDRGTSKRLLEVAIFDHHFGQLSWKPESGENYDIKIAKRIALEAVDSLIAEVDVDSIDNILLPIGNDFFNVNNSMNTTLKGTPQAEDCRWQKTFTEGLRLVIEIVNRLTEIAPVDVIIVSGNHDTERSFYMGEALFCFFDSNQYVTVENTPRLRKYYQWGKVALGFTHGDKNDRNKLPLLMATEAPKMWSSTKYREWHIGHIHAKKTYFYSIDEDNDVTIRVMPSLTATDDYHFGQGYSHMRKSIAVLWDSEKGQKAEYVYAL